MKTVTFIIALLMSASALAQSANGHFPFPKNTIGIEQVAGEVIQTHDLCPTEFICKRAGTVLVLRFEVGCLNELVGVSQKYDSKSNTLYVSAIRAITKDSLVAFCVAPTYKTANLVVNKWTAKSKIKYMSASKPISYPPPGTPEIF